ncbi:MAG: redoxin domain-containing protein, partial [Planctomycetes bacterium]|nr:redoxin domain-containing protein [Planctomycetota bacterium]
FLGTECPLAKLYGPRLARLCSEYESRGVGFLGVMANSQDSVTEIAAYARRHEIPFPLLKDVGNKLADQMGAVRTPEVFVLDGQRKIRYWGRIDDQYGIGFIRDEPQREDLRIALDELLAGKPVGTPQAESVGCHIGRVRSPDPDGSVTFSQHIAPILQRRCVECHREGEIAPFALTDYDEVVGWAEMIAEVVRQGRMPPWHADSRYGQFANDRHMPDEEKELIYRWLAEGGPQGGSVDKIKLPQYTDGWQLPRQPDLVIPVAKKPFVVPAEGEVRYQYFRVDPGFDQDRWIAAAELRPGNRAVVHHILVFATSRDDMRRFGDGAGGGFLAAYVPGLRSRPFPEGMAKRIPAGSQLIFQVHYTPIGSQQLDQSHLGLIFADPAQVDHEVVTTSAANQRFAIPPGDNNYRVEAYNHRDIPASQLLCLMPHMHLRGKSFRYEAILPGGQTEILLDVPSYDFNWQTAYRLTQPKSLPAGTRIHCVAHFDNSEDNLNNPDPAKTVRWGDQTWDEMMIGYFDLAVPLDQSSSRGSGSARSTGAGENRDRSGDVFRRLDRNGDDRVARDELPERWQPLFDRLDDGDGYLDRQELRSALEKLRSR